MSAGVSARETALKVLYYEGNGSGTIGMQAYEYCSRLKKKEKGVILVTLFAFGRQIGNATQSKGAACASNYSDILYPTKWIVLAIIEMERLERQNNREFLDVIRWFSRNYLHSPVKDRCSAQKLK